VCASWLSMQSSSVQGVIVPMVTPVSDNGRPDLHAVARLAVWLLDAGVGGLFVAGTTGRFSHFTPEENAEICRVVVETAKGRVPVLGGIADSGLRRMQANAERMAKAGADCLVATAPYYLKYSDPEREKVLATLVDTVLLPVMLYNIPELVGSALRAEWILDIAQHPNALGLKDSSNDYAFFERILTHRPKGFILIQGKEPLLARSILAGADGLVVSLAHMNPGLFVELCRAAKQGETAVAERCQREVQSLFDQLIAELKVRPCFSTLMALLEKNLAVQGMPVRLRGEDEKT